MFAGFIISNSFRVKTLRKETFIEK